MFGQCSGSDCTACEIPNSEHLEGTHTGEGGGVGAVFRFRMPIKKSRDVWMCEGRKWKGHNSPHRAPLLARVCAHTHIHKHSAT